jgi:dynein heavy chain, axonemal
MGSLLSVCLVRSIREDRTLVSSGNFILNVLGKEFTTPLSYPIDKIWEGSSNLEPILYLLSLGSDPTSSIEDLAKKKKKYPLKAVSMGEG